MKRSNRLILLIGIFLAVVVFAFVALNFQTTGGGPAASAPPQADTVYATKDIPLGTAVTQDMFETKKVDLDKRASDAVNDPGLVIGKTIRTDVKAGAQITQSMFASVSGQSVTPLIPKGLRAVAVRVDQSTGVGTLINVGDRVDMLISTDIALLNVDKTTGEIKKSDVTGTSTKLILQNMQVVGTLLPPPPAPTTAQQQQPQGAQPAQPATSLSGQNELVIVAATAQQAEVIKFFQKGDANDDDAITLVLRSPKDFTDQNGQPVTPAPDKTSGVVLKTLIDEYGVLPPQIVELVLPKGLQTP